MYKNTNEKNKYLTGTKSYCLKKMVDGIFKLCTLKKQ